MTHDEAIKVNLDKANEQLNRVQDDNPVEFVQTAMSVSNAYLLAALVAAVRELTGEVRNLKDAS